MPDETSAPSYLARQNTWPTIPAATGRRNWELEYLRKENARLRHENEILQARSTHANAHAAIAHWHINALMAHINHKKSSRKGKCTIRTTARCLTVGEGAEECDKEEAEEAAEAARKEEEQRRKEQEEADRQLERELAATNDSHVFSGVLARKRKEDLKMIAFALGLPLSGTNAQLSTAITEHLKAHPARYAADPKFAGLFTAANGLSRGQKRTLPSELNDENIPPPSQRPRWTSPATTHTSGSSSHSLTTYAPTPSYEPWQPFQFGLTDTPTVGNTYSTTLPFDFNYNTPISTQQPREAFSNLPPLQFTPNNLYNTIHSQPRYSSSNTG